MLAINNQVKFNEVVRESLAKAINFPRWQNAINKGVVQLELQGEFITWDADAKGLVIWSQDSNEVYSSNGVCQCAAFKKGFPCWHRALARIVRLYMERAEKRTPSAQIEAMLYIKPTRNVTPEFVGNIRIN